MADSKRAKLNQGVHDGQAGDAGSFLGLSFPWVIAALACFLAVVANANAVSFGVFFKPIGLELSWNRSQISGALGVSALVTAVSSTFMGYLTDRYGPRVVLLPCFALLGIGFVLMGRIEALWQLFLVQGFIMGLGGAGPFVCLAAIAGRWHERRRGMAVGLAVAGVGLSAAIAPPAAAKAIQMLGWREASTLFGVVVFSTGVLGSLVMRNPPAASHVRSSHAAPARKSVLHIWMIMIRLLKEREFLKLVAMFLLASVGTGLITNHFVNYATDAGVLAAVAASMMSVLGLANVLGRLSMGTVSDRIGTKSTLAMCFVLTTLALVALDSWVSVPILLIALAVFGCGYGGMVPMITRSIAEGFGTKHLAMLSGMMIAAVQIGLATGAWIGGWTFDLSGGYRWAFGLAAGFAITSLVVALNLRSQTTEDRARAQGMLDSFM